MPRKKNVLDGWITPEQMDVKPRERATWASEVVGAFIESGEAELGKKFEEEELRKNLNKLRTYLNKHEELKGVVKAGKAGDYIILKRID